MNALTNSASKSRTEGIVHLSGDVHLSEEQIDDELLGSLDAAAAAHLAACDRCANRVALACAPIASFRDATKAWGERRSATMPLPSVNALGLIWQRRMGWAMAAFVLATSIAWTGMGHKMSMLTASLQSAQASDASEETPVEMAAVAPPPVAVDTAEGVPSDRLASDNHMLKAIEVEVNDACESPAAMGLETVSDDRHSHASQPSLED